MVYIKMQTVANEWAKIMMKILETVENQRWFHSCNGRGKFNCVKWIDQSTVYSTHCTVYSKHPKRKVLLFHTLNCSKKHIILDTRSHRIGVHIKYAATIVVLCVVSAHTNSAHTIKGGFENKSDWKNECDKINAAAVVFLHVTLTYSLIFRHEL